MCVRAAFCVVIDRLPFAVPSDPLVAAGVAGADRCATAALSFDDYALCPRRRSMLRQGFGRLLRSHDDRGVNPRESMHEPFNAASYAEPLLAGSPSAPFYEITAVEEFFARPVELVLI